MLAGAGYPMAMMQADGLVCATVKLEISFKAPLHPGDRFYVDAIPLSIKGSAVSVRGRAVGLRRARELKATETRPHLLTHSTLCAPGTEHGPCAPPQGIERVVRLPRGPGERPIVAAESQTKGVFLDSRYRPAAIPAGLHAALQAAVEANRHLAPAPRGAKM